MLAIFDVEAENLLIWMGRAVRETVSMTMRYAGRSFGEVFGMQTWRDLRDRLGRNLFLVTVGLVGMLQWRDSNDQEDL